MDGKLKREQKEQKVEDSGYVRVNAREYAEFLKYKTAKRGEELRSEDQINMYFEILRSYFEDTFITDHLPGMDRYFSIQSFSNVAALFLEMEQFLEKELLNEERDGKDYMVKRDTLIETVRLIWMLTFHEIHKVPSGGNAGAAQIH